MRRIRRRATAGQTAGLFLCLGVSLNLGLGEGRPASPGPERSDSGTWVRHASFEDFRRGQTGNSGQNLYVSRSARIQVINRWDLNRDGYPDLLFTSSHDVIENPEALIYWGTAHGFESMLPLLPELQPRLALVRRLSQGSPGITSLPAFGGGRSLVTDLTNDGYPEIVFTNYIHNYPGQRTAYIYRGGPDGYRPHRRKELPTLWASGVAAADLNQDGFTDLVFANQGLEGARGLQDSERDRYPSYVYWGHPEGFLEANRTPLPSFGARDVAIDDWNRDGRPDIAFVNNSQQEQSCVIYWGALEGFSRQEVQRFSVEGATSLASGDLNRDGRPDLVITTGESHAWIFPGDGSRIDVSRKQMLAAEAAEDCVIQDLNGDALVDLAFANPDAAASSVFYASPEGFAKAPSTVLPTLRARGVDAADLNSDGYVDLVFANSGDAETADVPSYIYWGSATGYVSYLRSDLTGFGAVSVRAGDFNRDERPDVLLINQTSGTNEAEVDSLIYWGNPHHYYSTVSVTTLPSVGAYGSITADLNDDGWTDVLICNSGPAYLYWGGPDGYAADRRQELGVSGAYNGSAADFNRDGYLDLLFSHRGNEKARSTILWGGSDGFVKGERKQLELEIKTSLTHSVADLNKDGYLDVVFPDASANRAQFLWGSPAGLEKSTVIETPAASIEVADLDADGWLDLVFAGRQIPETRSYDTRTIIYWGGPGGFQRDQAQELESFHTPEMAIADLNHDGNLDLVLVSYLSNHTRTLPVLIYWGDGRRRYGKAKWTALPAESSSGLQILDLNRNGYRDLVVHNHIRDGNHDIDSYIYWGGAEGLSVARRTHLPTFGPHHSQLTDPGNLYSREFEEEYLSPAIDLPAGRRFTRLSWKAEVPPGTSLLFQVRSSDSDEGLKSSPWQGPNGSESFYTSSMEALKGIQEGNEWLQYRVLFRSQSGADYPVLTEVAVHYE